MPTKLNPQWIVGFVDGEGCFYVGINKMFSMRHGIQVLPDFTVVQHIRDIKVLYELQAYFGCGVVRVNNGDRWAYRVRGHKAILDTIIPFFDKYPLITKKQQDYLLFRGVIQMMANKEHLLVAGIRKIELIKQKMNTQVYIPMSPAKKPKI